MTFLIDSGIDRIPVDDTLQPAKPAAVFINKDCPYPPCKVLPLTLRENRRVSQVIH